MNELEILKEIGIKEISRKTHIEPVFLQSIVDKDFAKLVRLNAKGYIKILQREYNIDLGWWLEEYESFLNENKPDESKKTKINPKISSYTSDEIVTQRSGGSLGWLFWVVILALIAFGAYYFDIYKYAQSIPSFFSDENRSAVYSESSIVSEVKKNIIDTNITITQAGGERLSADKNASQSEREVTAPAEQNLSAPQLAAQDVKLDQNAGTQSSALEKLTTSISSKDTNSSEFIGSADEALIIPKQKVWIGIINLENGQKISSDSNKNVSINLKQRQLIVCGNGSIELKVGDKVSRFTPSRPARFLVENGEIKSISYDEFIALNKGKSW
ncbi:MAG: phosphatidylglycerophosphate synthase [Campylobacter curvus]